MNDFFQHGSTSDYSHSNGDGSDFLVGLQAYFYGENNVHRFC